jgi:fatty-acyl-CoA synthase
MTRQIISSRRWSISCRALPRRRLGRRRAPVLGRDERGEIVVRGSLVMAGCYKNPQASAEAARYGWHHTGDIGYLDEDNYLFIVDRAKDVIITGGFNVYSAEVEQVLLAHPAVQD